jgi:TonB-dependent receptor
MTIPADWQVDALFDNADKDKGDAVTLTLDGELDVDIGWINRFSFGLRWDDRGAEENERRQSAPPLLQPLSNFDVRLIHTNSGFFDGRANMPTSWIAADGHFLYANRDEFRVIFNGIDPNFQTTDQLGFTKLFEVDEVTTALYAQADFATEIGGRTLDGQFGVRYVDVETDMTFGSGAASASASKALPNFMVRLAITEDWIARLSYGQTLRRPDFADLNPNINLLPDVTEIGRGTAVGGNPNLKPTESTNIDLSVEWYFADSSSLYATLFKRDIEGFVVPSNSFFVFENPDNPSDPNNGDYILTIPNNTSNGKLDGFELGLVWFPESLPGFLDGFGVQASFTSLDSSQDLPTEFDDDGRVVATQNSPLFSVSDTSYSIVLAYDKGSFDARLSYVWREAFKLDNDAPIFANPLARYSSDEESLDFQLSYHATESLVFTFDATNITDQVFQTNYGRRSNLMNFGSSIFSKTYALGVRYSF